MDFTVEPLSEDALLLRFGDCIDVTVNARVLAVAHALREAALSGVTDIAPAYASLLLRFDPAVWNVVDPESLNFRRLFEIASSRPESVDTKAPGPGPGSESGVTTLRREDVQRQKYSISIAANAIEIPVCYDGTFGPDLEAVASHAGLPRSEVITRHTAAEYMIAMLGFAPGFPYLFGLDAALHAPRHHTPRTRVPAGSVAIGGAQTGIYPRELPGGWNLIGRTPLVLFDPQREPPCLLKPGDRVRFCAIEPEQFDALTDRPA